MISTQEWKGSRPQRFSKGKKHNNHPLDELDHLLLGSDTPAQSLGPSKKRFEGKITIGSDQVRKPQVRPNVFRNKSNIEFGEEIIPKLIKINKQGLGEYSMGSGGRGTEAKDSKIKNLQNGTLQTGIYRNFYQSQLVKNSNSTIE